MLVGVGAFLWVAKDATKALFEFQRDEVEAIAPGGGDTPVDHPTEDRLGFAADVAETAEVIVAAGKARHSVCLSVEGE